MFSGPDVKVSYNGEHLRRALTSCGATCTFQVSGDKTPSFLEADDYWHILMPKEGFPREVSLGANEREALELMEESVKAVRTGEVVGRVLMGDGKFYLELTPGLVVSQVLTKTPVLAEGCIPPVVENEADNQTEGDN